jgi:NAD(P) transhydrogenase subunit alpha
MKIAVPKETQPGERRVALVPESCKKLRTAGIDVAVQAGAGEASYFSDDAYREVGAAVESDLAALLGSADLLLRVQAPEFDAAAGRHELDFLRPGSMLLATLLPVKHLDAVRRLAKGQITAFSTTCIPRSTRAQSMDTLSSMANIAGYKAVLIAANASARYFPMFMTAAGTVFAAKVFIIGAGVAGLQAIATARRLGANVVATDTRPAVKEEVESLGARFVGVATTEAAQDAGGYAKELSQDFYTRQSQLIAEQCAAADVVITTALIGGVKAPRLITSKMVANMKPGSVIVDLAAEAGGNCERTRPGETTVTENGITVCGPLNLPSEMPIHGSTLYSRNLTTFVLEFWKGGKFNLNFEDEILRAAVVTHGGQVMHKGAAEALAAGGGIQAC